MALTRDALRTTTPTGAVSSAPSAPGLLPGGRAAAIGLAWALLFPLAIALEPAASQPDVAWWEVATSVLLLASIVAVTVGLAKRTRWAINASLVASAVFTAGVIACPTTGHHPMGLWWFGELACGLGILGVSAVVALRPADR